MKDRLQSRYGHPTFKAGFSVKGTQYALPFDTSARAMFYNKKAFAAAGLRKPPSTWAEVKSDGQALKAKGYIGVGSAPRARGGTGGVLPVDDR